MNLMKWLRKNNKKLMAVVVIVLMIAFIGGSSFSMLFRGSGGAKRAIAYYGQKHKINYFDRRAADQELEILGALGGDSIARAQGIGGLLLSELIFRQNREAGMVDMARQTIQRNRFRISDRQLSQMFEGNRVPGDLYWILLTEEARTAGIRVSNEEVGRLLEQAIPQLSRGASYAQVIPALMNRFNAPEDRILSTVGKLLAVLQYAQIICSGEDITTAQIKHMASNESESLNAELVQFKASYFANKDEIPPEQTVAAQFDKYKDNFPGAISEANPFGFGYRLPDRVQFDYLALKLSDVATIAKPVTEEEAEQYYQQNRERQYTQKVPKDPNDPNSAQVTQVKSYAEVADTIRQQLQRQRVITRAEQILQDARNLADVNLPAVAIQGREPTVEQRQKKAGDYIKIAKDLGDKLKIPLYSGRTGLLSATEVQSDKYLRRLYLTTYGYSPVPLTQVLFSVKELGERATILLSMPPATLYVTFGPARDPMSATATDVSGQIMLIARVVAAEKDAPPTNVGVYYSTRTPTFGATPDKKSQNFSVEEQVVNDVKALAAWNTTKSKAEEFMALATKDGWDKAVAQFNKLYGPQAKADPNDPNVFRVDNQVGLQRLSQADQQVLAAQIGNSPASQVVLNQATNEGLFVDRLRALIPDKSDSPAQMPVLVEFKPNQSYYVLKSLTLQRLTQEEFQKMKGMIVRREEYSQIESLMAVHFNPENIVKRMNFRFAEPQDQAAGGETNQPSKEAS
ncbi:MAG: hypothetical protein M1376_02985 [Planctomycetes bacterium]|nr:hypothetical protein [Planctomycetota bacterium]